MSSAHERESLRTNAQTTMIKPPDLKCPNHWPSLPRSANEIQVYSLPIIFGLSSALNLDIAFFPKLTGMSMECTGDCYLNIRLFTLCEQQDGILDFFSTHGEIQNTYPCPQCGSLSKRNSKGLFHCDKPVHRDGNVIRCRNTVERKRTSINTLRCIFSLENFRK